MTQPTTEQLARAAQPSAVNLRLIGGMWFDQQVGG